MSRWRTLCQVSAPYRGQADWLSEEGLKQALAAIPSFTTRKRMFLLYRWVLREHRRVDPSILDVTKALERDYIRDARPILSVVNPESIPVTLANAATQVARGWKGARLKALVLLGGETGLRTEELRLLPFNSVSQGGEGWLVSVPGQKAKPPRSFTLSTEAGAAVEAWLAAHPCPGGAYLFVADALGAPLVASSIWRQIKRLEGITGAVAAPVSGVSALRTAFAATLKERGVAPPDLQQALGHKHATSTAELLERIHSFSSKSSS